MRRAVLLHDDVNRDIGRPPKNFVGQRAPQQSRKRPRARAAQDDLRDILASRETQRFACEIVAWRAGDFRPEPFREPERLVDASHDLSRFFFLAGALDVKRNPGGVEGRGEARAGANHRLGVCIAADADEQAFRRRPGAFDRSLPKEVDHLIVDAFRGSTQGKFAQRREVARREEILRRASRGLGNIDLAILQSLQQFFRRDVDKDDVGGVLQDAIRHGLAHRDAGDARYDVGEAFKMLDIERRPDVDAGVEQLLDILPAFGMAAVWRVGVREFVDEDELRFSRQRRVYVEFLDDPTAIFAFAAWKRLKTVEERLRLRAPVSFRDAYDNIDALSLDRLRARQHRVGFADAGRGAEEHAKFPFALLVAQGKERIGVGSSVEVSVVAGQRRLPSGASPLF